MSARLRGVAGINLGRTAKVATVRRGASVPTDKTWGEVAFYRRVRIAIMRWQIRAEAEER